MDRRTSRDTLGADSLLAKGLAADPGHPWLLSLQAERLVSQGKDKDAREVLKKTLDYAPTFRPAMEVLAGVELRSGNLCGRRGSPSSRCPWRPATRGATTSWPKSF
jgi:predicted Zn-dependent protease